MQRDRTSQGIVLDEKSQEQPKDKERAQRVHMTGPARSPSRADKDLKENNES